MTEIHFDISDYFGLVSKVLESSVLSCLRFYSHGIPHASFLIFKINFPAFHCNNNISADGITRQDMKEIHTTWTQDQNLGRT